MGNVPQNSSTQKTDQSQNMPRTETEENATLEEISINLLPRLDGELQRLEGRGHLDGDLPGAAPKPVDWKLKGVYGDYPHQNDGTTLKGGVKDDEEWQKRWRKVIALPSRREEGCRARRNNKLVKCKLKWKIKLQACFKVLEKL